MSTFIGHTAEYIVNFWPDGERVWVSSHGFGFPTTLRWFDLSTPNLPFTIFCLSKCKSVVVTEPWIYHVEAGSVAEVWRSHSDEAYAGGILHSVFDEPIVYPELVVDDTHLYVMGGTSTDQVVMRVPLAAHNAGDEPVPAELVGALGIGPTDYVQTAAVDADSVWLLVKAPSSGMSLHRVDKVTGLAELGVEAAGSPFSIVSDGKRVFWGDSRDQAKLRILDIASGTVTYMRSPGGPASYVHDGYLYNARYGVYRWPLSGCRTAP